MSGIIIYRSNYGSTRQYAQWIHEETGFPLFESRDRSILWNVDTIVIGCPIIAFRPSLLNWIRKHWAELAGKRVLLFTTSGADPAKQPVREMIERSLPSPLRQGVRLFPLAGRFVFSEMSGAHKMTLRFVAYVLRMAAVRNQIKTRIDGVARENLRDLLDAIRG